MASVVFQPDSSVRIFDVGSGPTQDLASPTDAQSGGKEIPSPPRFPFLVAGGEEKEKRESSEPHQEKGVRREKEEENLSLALVR